MEFDKVGGMMYANVDLRYSRIFDGLLPTLGDDHFCAHLAARAHSYMTYLMVPHNWKPWYYKPHRALLWMPACVIERWISIKNNDSWSTWDPLEAIGPLKECMPCGAFRYMYCCMHFNDDFDNESPDEWSDVYSDKKHPLPATARHRKKISNVEDATICQKWWKILECG